MTNVREKFLVNRDETGKEIVTYPSTGKKYYVEYISPRTKADQTNWGDLDPATKKVTGTYGQKYKGSIQAEESVITKENGFDDVHEGKGSPYAKIHQLHEKWKDENGY